MTNYYVFIFLILLIVIFIIGYFMSCHGKNCGAIPNSKLKTPRTPRTPYTPKSVDFKDTTGNIIKAIVQNKSGQKLHAQVGSILFGVDIILPTIYELDIDQEMVIDSSTSGDNIKLAIINGLLGKTGVYKIASINTDLTNITHQYINNFPGAGIKIPPHDFTLKIVINSKLMVDSISII